MWRPPGTPQASSHAHLRRHGICASLTIVIRFQVSDKNKIDEISEAFATFDRDASGTISSAEFQNICFEIGEVLTEEQVARAVAEIDLD